MSGFSEEVALRNKISRAFSSARNAPQEKKREIFGELMKCLQSNYHSVRVAAASQLSLLFKHVAEMQEQAIDNILDLCEDPDSMNRAIGYQLLTETAKREPAWVPRNTDVLVQLLQNEDPVELQNIQTALLDIIKDSAANALPILAEYLAGNDAEHTLDLRNHVLVFLTGGLKHEVVSMLLNDDVSLQVVEGLVKILEVDSTANTGLIVDKLLHPFFNERPSSELASRAIRAILENVEVLSRNYNALNQQSGAKQLATLYELASLLAVQCEGINAATETIEFADRHLFPQLHNLHSEVQGTFVMVVLSLYKSRFSNIGSSLLSASSPARAVMTNWLSEISKTLIQASAHDPEALKFVTYYLLDVIKPQLDRNAILRDKNLPTIKEVRLALEKFDNQSSNALIHELKKMEISPVKISRVPPSGPAKRDNPSTKTGPSLPTGPSNKRKADSLASTPALSPAPSLISRLNLSESAGSDNDSPEPRRDPKRHRNDSLLSRLSDNPTSSVKSNTIPPLSHPLPPRPVSYTPGEGKSIETQMHNGSDGMQPTGLRMRGAANGAPQSQPASTSPSTSPTSLAPTLSFLGAAKKLQAAGSEKLPPKQPSMLARLQQQPEARKAESTVQSQTEKPTQPLLMRTQATPASIPVVSLAARLESKEDVRTLSLVERLSGLNPNEAGGPGSKAGMKKKGRR